MLIFILSKLTQISVFKFYFFFISSFRGSCWAAFFLHRLSLPEKKNPKDVVSLVEQIRNMLKAWRRICCSLTFVLICPVTDRVRLQTPARHVCAFPLLPGAQPLWARPPSVNMAHMERWRPGDISEARNFNYSLCVMWPTHWHVVIQWFRTRLQLLLHPSFLTHMAQMCFSFFKRQTLEKKTEEPSPCL